MNETDKFFMGCGTIFMFLFVGFALFMYSIFFAPPINIVVVLGILYFITIIYVYSWFVNGGVPESTAKLFAKGSIIGAVLFVVCIVYNIYVDYVPTVDESSSSRWLYEYKAFYGKLVAKLDESTTLSLTDELPIIDCATALYPVVSAFVEAVYPPNDYNRFNPPVYCSGTSDAYKNLIDGKADIIFTAGPSEEQKAMAEEYGVEMVFTPIGKEAFVFFVNSKNAIENLTVEEIQRIFSGEIRNWKAVGGKRSTIKAYQRSQNSGSQTALLQIMENRPLMDAPSEYIILSMEGMITEVVTSYRNFENALGFSFRFYSTEMVKNNQIRLLKINDIYPDRDTIRDNTYPFSSKFYAITASTDNPNVEAFIEWILSPQGQYLIEETGYVGIDTY